MDRRIATAIELMQVHTGKAMGVREFARAVHLSQWHFIHLFKAETSLTPKQYMQQLRMKRAEALLSTSFLSVKEIAARLGFEDPSHFSRKFKEFSGVSPSLARSRRNVA